MNLGAGSHAPTGRIQMLCSLWALCATRSWRGWRLKRVKTWRHAGTCKTMHSCLRNRVGHTQLVVLLPCLQTHTSASRPHKLAAWRTRSPTSLPSASKPPSSPPASIGLTWLGPGAQAHSFPSPPPCRPHVAPSGCAPRFGLSGARRARLRPCPLPDTPAPPHLNRHPAHTQACGSSGTRQYMRQTEYAHPAASHMDAGAASALHSLCTPRPPPHLSNDSHQAGDTGHTTAALGATLS